MKNEINEGQHDQNGICIHKGIRGDYLEKKSFSTNYKCLTSCGSALPVAFIFGA